MDMFFMSRLDVARHLSGVPIRITSGFRCPMHNAKESVGGSPTSSHLSGLACDIAVDDSNRFKILKALMDVGLTRMKLSFNHIHVDCDEDKMQEYLGLY